MFWSKYKVFIRVFLIYKSELECQHINTMVRNKNLNTFLISIFWKLSLNIIQAIIFNECLI